MSSKTSQQQQQQPMSWRSAAKQQKDKSSQQQQQQQQNGRANGFKTEGGGGGKEKNGGKHGGGGGGPTQRMTPNSANSTPMSRTSTASKGLDASAFDAANNMMPNFARSQHQYQQQQPQQNQQSHSRPPSTQAQLYVGRNSLERIEPKNRSEAQNNEENNKRHHISNEKQQQQQQAKQPKNGNAEEEQNQQRRASTNYHRSNSEEGSGTERERTTENEQRNQQNRTSPSLTENEQQQQMGKNNVSNGNRRSATPKSASPTPVTPPSVSAETKPEEAPAGDGKTTPNDAEKMALANPEEVIKHPLKHKWAMWYFKNDKSKDWKENQRYVYSFNTVEDFWALYNHLVPPSELQSGCDYSLFKEGIEPMWEDPKNVDGGRWLINSMKQQRQAHLDRMWMETLLCLVGEAFDDASDEVCGTVVNIRPKGDKLAIWTRNAEDQDNNLTVGRGLRERLGLHKQIQLGFQVHKDTATKYGSITRNKYVV